MRTLYSLLTYLLRPFAFAVVLWRGLGNRAYWIGLHERFGWGAPVDPSPTLWVHAVSLGEVTAAAALIHALRARHPDLPLVLTTATPTGRARATALFGATVTVRFLPYDTPGAMRRFLSRVRPRLAIIMETELWPNLYRQCQRRGIPIVLANARLSAKSVARYRRFSGLATSLFAGDTFVAAQSVDDANRFLEIGADPDRTQVIGNLKFDIALGGDALDRGHAMRSNQWSSRPVWIAGSTHADEEESVLIAHDELRSDVPGSLLLLVPRHPERFQLVADLLNRHGVSFDRRSSGKSVSPDARVLLVDTVGELGTLYAAADVAFVGGSLVPVGGHNLLEPAAFGIPVLTGPHWSNAKDVASSLLRAGAALEVKDATELAERLRELFADPARRRQMGARGLNVIAANRGSLSRLLEVIDSRLTGYLAARSRPSDAHPPVSSPEADPSAGR